MSRELVDLLDSSTWLNARELRRVMPLDYSKYQVRRLPGSGTKAWHVWCPPCVVWLCCRNSLQGGGYTKWAQATESLETHRKIWHT